MFRLQNLVRQREALRLQRLQLLQRQRRLRFFFRLLCNSPPRAKMKPSSESQGEAEAGREGSGSGLTAPSGTKRA